MRVRVLQERKLGRLGRHIEHDPRSKSFSTVHAKDPLISAKWIRHCLPFDQGEVGSCTCEAAVGVKMTGHFFDQRLILGQADCVSLYQQATKLDKIPGHYPPEDTGSSGLAAAKAAHKRGWFKSYHHAFGLRAALASLGRGPGMLGISWYEGFDMPSGSRAELVIGGQSRGGHEVCLTEIDVDAGMVRGVNSWGTTWGDAGYFSISFDTLDQLLQEDGDYVVPIL